jgi:bacillithiol biosynthesis deacetylase BshB1
MKLDVLAIGAHPDDVELSCGGTLIMLARQGKSVGVLDLTRGELGTRGTQAIRAREAAQAARVMGVAVRENLGLPDGNIEDHLDNRLKLVRVLRTFAPDVLLFPYREDRHPDHERAHVLCREAWFAAGLQKVVTRVRGRSQEPFRPRAYYNFMQWHEFRPTFILDITSAFDQRVEAIQSYKSQFHDPDNTERETVLSTPHFMEMVRMRLAYYGDTIGVRYGEPFYSSAAIKVQDIVALNT